MPDRFFLVVGLIPLGIGLLMLTAKVMAYIKCTVPIHATVVKLEKEYTEKAHFRTPREMKYPIGSKMEICFNPGKPEEMRVVGHSFPLPAGLMFLFIGAAFCKT